MAVKPGEDSNEEGEAEEKEEEPDEPEPEVGPPLLTPLSQDAGQSLTFPAKPILASRVTKDVISIGGRGICCPHFKKKTLLNSYTFLVSL